MLKNESWLPCYPWEKKNLRKIEFMNQKIKICDLGLYIFDLFP